MSEKKHIDRLFQEKLKDFEVTPDDAVWDKIHDRLHEDKRKRRVIPIWWRVAGVAALLTLILTVGLKFMSNNFDSDATNPVVETENQLPNKSNESKAEDRNNSEARQNQTENTSDVASENSLNTDDFSNENSNDTSNDASEKNRFNQNATTNSKSDRNRIVDNEKSNSKENSSKDELYKERISNPSSKENNTSNTKNAVADVSDNDENNSNKNNLLDNRKEKSEIDKLIKDSKNDANSKVTNTSETNEDVSSEEKLEELKKDSIEENSIENAIAEANTDDEKEKKLNRWNISPNVAPVYFNTLGQGSTLDDQFVNNNKSSEVTMSYGIGGSYAINDRIKVRAGINKVDMGYNTNNVIAYSSIDASSQTRTQLDNVDMNANANNMTFLSTEALNRNNTPEIINSKSNGAINQRFGFIEVPLEMEYAVINKKLAINVIGGFSTLIVDTNEIYSVVNGAETRIGEANNINNMSYSANFGLGINYNISEKIKVNVEPTFKYQINTFSNSSGDFQPYFIGVYTGLSYKF